MKSDKCALIKSVLDDLQWCHMLAIISALRDGKERRGLIPIPLEVLARDDLRDGSIQLSTADTAGQYLLLNGLPFTQAVEARRIDDPEFRAKTWLSLSA